MTDEVLPEFQNFLITRKLVPDRYTKFYAYWVSKFLAFSNAHIDMRLEDRIHYFLKFLREKDSVAEWQVHQANTAIKGAFDAYGVFYPLTLDRYTKDGPPF